MPPQPPHPHPANFGSVFGSGFSVAAPVPVSVSGVRGSGCLDRGSWRRCPCASFSGWAPGQPEPFHFITETPHACRQARRHARLHPRAHLLWLSPAVRSGRHHTKHRNSRHHNMRNLYLLRLSRAGTQIQKSVSAAAAQPRRNKDQLVWLSRAATRSRRTTPNPLP